MTVLEKYGNRKFKFYTGNKFEVIIFNENIWGKPHILIKYKEYDKFDGAFVETTGGMGYASNSFGNNEAKYNLKNIFEEFIQEIILYIQNDKAFISTTSTNFEFIIEEPKPNLDGETLLELPQIRVVEHLCQFKDDFNKYIIVDRDKYDYSLPQKFYYGSISNYETLDIENYLRYRDGGTVVISTTNGCEFMSPSPFKEKAKTIWTNKKGDVFELNKVKGEYSHNTKMFLDKLGIKEK